MADEGQLSIEQQINAAIQQRQALLAANNEQMNAQVQLAMELCKALECEDLEGMSERLGGVREGMAAAADGAARVGKESTKMSKGLKQGNDRLKQISKTSKPMLDKKRGFLVAGFVALKNKIQSAGIALKNFGKLIMSAYGLFSKVKDAIMSIPFKIMDRLREAARGAGNAGLAVANAYESIKSSFGSLASNEGEAVAKGFNRLASGSWALSAAGVSVASVYGKGPEGIAAAMEDFLKAAEAIGPTISILGEDMGKHAGHILAIGKALDFTGDDYRALADRAVITGQSMREVMAEHAKDSVSMGKAVGVSAQLISKNLLAMQKNYGQFGGRARKELMATAAYAAKLGIEMKTLQEIGKKFDDFESAAESVSQLSQAFGVQLDAVEMLNASEAERMDMLREGLEAAGQNWEDLSRQEKQYMAESVGISSIEDLGKALEGDVSYDDMLAGAEDAENSAISEAEAMRELAKSIRKMHQAASSAGEAGEGLWGSFFAGINKGIMNSRFMLDLLSNIDQIFNGIYEAGMVLGTFIGDLFGEGGPLQSVGKAIMNVFQPERYIKMFKSITGSVTKFLTDLFKLEPILDADGKIISSVGKQAQALGENLIQSLFGIFDVFNEGQESAMGGLLDTVKNFLPLIGNAILGMVTGLVRYAAKALRNLAKTIRGLGKQRENVKETEQGFLSMIWDGLVAAWDALFGSNGVIWELFDALGEVLMAAWDYVGRMWPTWWESIKEAATNVWNKLYRWITEDGVDMLTGAVAGIFGFAREGQETSTSWATDLKEAVGKAWNELGKWWEESDRAEELKIMLGKAWVKVKEMGKQLWTDYVRPAMEAAWENVKDFAEWAWPKLKEALSSLWEKFGDNYPNLQTAIEWMGIAILGFLALAVGIVLAIGTVVAVVVGVVMGIIWVLWQVAKVIATVLGFAWDIFSTVFSAIWDVVSWAFNAIWNIVTWVWTNALSPFLSWLWETAGLVFGFLWDTVSWVFNAIWSLVSWVATGIWNSLSWLFGWIGDAFEAFGDLADDVGKGIRKGWKNLKKGAKAVGKAVGKAWDDMSKAVGNKFDDMTTSMGEWRDSMAEDWETVKENSSVKWEETKEAFTEIWGQLGEWWEENMSLEAWRERWTGITEAFDEVKGKIEAKVTEVFAPIGEAIRDALEPINTLIDNVIGTYAEDGGGILGTVYAMATGFSNSWTRITESVSGVFSQSAWETRFSGISRAWTVVVDAIKEAWNDCVDAIPGDLADGLKIQSPSQVMLGMGANIGKGLMQGIGDEGISPYQDAIGGLAEGMEDAGKRMARVGKNMTEGLTSPITRDRSLIESVTAMIAEVAELDTALNQIEDIDIVARLQQVADTYAIGPTSDVVVNHRPVQITVNFKVEMDVEEVARVLVQETKYVAAGAENIPDDG